MDLQKLGLLMSGIASTTSRDPRYLQTNLVMQDAFSEMKDRERMEAEQQKQDLLLRRLSNPTSQDMIGTPQTKAFEVNGRTVGQNAPGTMGPVMPDEMRLRSLQRAFPKEFMFEEMRNRMAGPAKPMVVGENAAVIDAQGNEIYRNAAANEPDLSKDYQRQFGSAVPSGYRPVVQNGKMTGAVSPIAGFQREETGARWEPMSEAEKRERNLDANAPYKIDRRSGDYQIVSSGTRFNNDQNLAAGFANRMDLAEQEVAKVGENYPDFDPTSYVEAAKSITNKTMTVPNQLYRQAQENWVTANLRKESGAAIGADEMDREIKKYFPQAGDKPELLEQKARARAAAKQGLVYSSGGAYEGLKKTAPAEAAPAKSERPKDAPENARQAKNGKWYAPDPLRPGKYVEY